MPGKPRRRKGKHSPQKQSKKGGPSRPAIAAQQLAVAQTHQPAFRSGASVPSTSVPTPVAKPAAVRHPYIAAELRTTAILAGIMLIILTVLAFVLS